MIESRTAESGTPGTSASDYDYALPPERIAQYPTERRDESRLLVVPRSVEPDKVSARHLVFRDLPTLFRAGDLLVLNETRVFPARLLGRKPTGAPAEVLLLHPLAGDDKCWEALVRPGGKLKPGRRVIVSEDLEVEVLDSTPEGGRIVRMVTERAVEEVLDEAGRVPLPPYLGRPEEPLDRERYQTVYAREPGSVAAPTAGLHFTPELLGELAAAGVSTVKLSLHVGVGTFRPIEVEQPDEHPMHTESFEIPEKTAAAVNEARAQGGRIWAVGTTVVRALESSLRGDQVRAGRGTTNLFIRPPYTFQSVDCLITNFHLPRSTLLMLVAAFAGYRRTMDAYQEAIREGYRFYSYGDAMAVVDLGDRGLA